MAPATDEYVLGAPLFQRITLELENGNTLVISAPNNSDENRYVQRITWNGKPYEKNYVRHSELMEGGTLEFEMGPEPNTARGTEENAFPYSLSRE